MIRVLCELLRCAQIESDALQAMPGLKFGAGDVRVVIPDETAVERRQMCEENRDSVVQGASLYTGTSCC